MEEQELKKASVAGIAASMGAQAARLALTFLYQIVIARLLLPHDFGLVAMSGPVVAFVQIFADLGLTQATIQRRSITQEQLSFLFWLNVAMGIAVALATVALSPLVGWFYGDARTVNITMVLGTLFVLGGFYAQHAAILNRRMQFISLAAIDLTSFLCGGLASIAAAALGAGYWAILVNPAVTSVVYMALAWRFARWRPSRPALCEDARSLLGFGGNMTIFSVADFFARNMDNILIGRFSGPVQLGFYDRAYKLCLLPFNQVSYPFARVAMPLLSRTVDEPGRYRSSYSRLLEANLMLAYPGVVFAIATIDQLVAVALGPHWTGVAPIFRVLALDAFVAPIGSSFGWLFVSQNRTREMRNCGLLSSMLFVTAFVIGLSWGAVGVAAGYVSAGLLEILVLMYVVTRRGPVNLAAVLRPLLPSAVCAGLVWVALRLAQGLLAPGLPALGLLAVGSYLLFFLLMAFTSSGRQVLREAAQQLQARLYAPILRRYVRPAGSPPR